MKKLLFALFLLTNAISFSQELAKDFKIYLVKKAAVFQIVEEQKKQVCYFFSGITSIKTVRFNENFGVIDSLSTSRPAKEYEAVVGYSITDNKYFTYWSDNKKLLAQCFDFDTKQVTSKSFDIEFSEERIIKKITVNNVFYIITILKNSSILNFYALDNNKLEKKTIDLSGKKFLGKENKVELLWDLLSRGDAYELPFSFKNISNESPPSLVFSSCKRKVYTQGNTIIFTIDISKRFTQLFSVNLTDFTFFQKSYNQPYVEETLVGSGGVDSNSFFIDSQLIQMKLNTEKMLLSVKDLDGNELKSFEVIDGKEIAFKNSEIMQENKDIKNIRVLDKSSQLLRKIYYQNPSVSCYSFNNKKYLSIGSVSDPENNTSLLVLGGMHGFIGSMIAYTIWGNYSIDNLNSYRGRKVVYINCQFDNDFNHIDGDLKKLAFDELRLFADKNQ